MTKKNKEIRKEQNASPETVEATATTEQQTSTETASEKKEEPAEDPAIKARKTKEKQMCNNMHVFLRSKQIPCDLFEQKEKPYFKVIGTSNTEKPFKFILHAHPELQNEKGNPQVLMLIEAEENRFVQMHPQNNTHLVLLLQHHVPGLVTIEPEA